MFNILDRLWPKKRSGNTATIAGAISLAAVSGALLTWYASRNIRRRRDNEFLYNQDDESQQ